MLTCNRCGLHLPAKQWAEHTLKCNGKFILGIDFDGTCVKHLFPAVGPDCPGAVNWLRKFVEEGASLILWTVRGDQYLTAAVHWFAQRNIPLYGVNINPTQVSWTSSPKALADYYIDDRAIGCPLIPDFEIGRPYVDWEKVGPYVLELMAMS